MRPASWRRAEFRHFLSIPTRWHDNDAYGHINNVVYYEFFDTAVNRFLMQEGLLDIENGESIGLVVETRCHYFAPAAFPDALIAGLRVARCGISSVSYEIAIFKEDGETAVAQGHFVHVYVDRRSRRPMALSAAMRQGLERIAGPGVF